MTNMEPGSGAAGLAEARRVVVKVGSAVIAPGGVLDTARVAALAAQLALAARSGRDVVVVSSGAVASGFRALGLDAMPRSIIRKQAAAAVGQPLLMRAWDDALGTHAVRSAQVLLTADDLDHRERHLNARRTLDVLLDARVVPIINENDSVSFEEIKVGDNDRLAALVAALVGADALVMLSVAPGLCVQGDPARVIATVDDIAAARAHVQTGTSGVGTGGMGTKLDAAEIATECGARVVIAPGALPDVLTRLLAGEAIGTAFVPSGLARRARDRWLGRATRVRGTLVVDDGCRDAVVDRHASILPIGVRGVEGVFEAGAAVAIRTQGGELIARGLSAYSSDDARRLVGVRSDQIESVLGYCYREEIVHRDDLVLVRGKKGTT
ncbi:MAG: glutamate 5-kinase [Planctomycetota bacterium]|nr:glutamate 5-kinase [Planctomycetota bacterium]